MQVCILCSQKSYNLILFLGHIPSKSPLGTDVEKLPDDLRKAYPVQNKDNIMHLVLFVASGEEEPVESIMKTFRNSVRNVRRGKNSTYKITR